MRVHGPCLRHLHKCWYLCSCDGWFIVMMKWQDITHRQTQPFIFEVEASKFSKDVLNCIVLAWIWFIIEYNLTSSHTQLNSIWVNIWSLIRALYEIETYITLQLLQLEFKYSISSHIFKPKLKFHCLHRCCHLEYLQKIQISPNIFNFIERMLMFDVNNFWEDYDDLLSKGSFIIWIFNFMSMSKTFVSKHI